MYLYRQATTELFKWIRDEVEFEKELGDGNRGMAVQRVQEWLGLHAFGVVIDSSFGPVTGQAVGRFQESVGLARSGRVDEATFAKLVAPMRELVKRRPAGQPGLAACVLDYAQAHLAAHPREVGGQNRGPWVRLYMKGNEGAPWAWCAGFVAFLLHQAAETLGVGMPIEGSFSCDTLAAQARTAGRFVAEGELAPGAVPPGSVFLVRRTSTDWTHTGLVIRAGEVAFDTIEGNTNDDGHREGFEVCSRSRGYSGKDFARVS